MVAAVQELPGAGRLVLALHRVRPARYRALGPHPRARLLRGDDGRHSRRDGRGGLGAGRAARRSGRRADLRAVRRHVPGADVGARPRRVVRAADMGARLPLGARRGDAAADSPRVREELGAEGLRPQLPGAVGGRRRAIRGVVRAGLPFRGALPRPRSRGSRSRWRSTSATSCPRSACRRS